MKKYLIVTMSNGNKFQITTRDIAVHRAKKICWELEKDDKPADFGTVYKETVDLFTNDESALLDWASTQMEWKHVKDYAHRIKTITDFTEWPKAPKELVDETQALIPRPV